MDRSPLERTAPDPAAALPDGQKPTLPPPPRPATEREAALEARIRMKFQFGEPLSWAEKQYIRRLPDQDVHYQK
jgi:hypothetical protein